MNNIKIFFRSTSQANPGFQLVKGMLFQGKIVRLRLCLSILFHRVYCLSCAISAPIASFTSQSLQSIYFWDLIFRRNLNGREWEYLSSLLSFLVRYHLNNGPWIKELCWGIPPIPSHQVLIQVKSGWSHTLTQLSWKGYLGGKEKI